MKSPNARWLMLLIGLVSAGSGNAAAADAPSRPNVILIMTDNQGAWSLGCYGNRDVQTPHIDRLAREGTLFSRCYSNNAVCSPTRATFLTGLMPCQHGVHSYLAHDKTQMGPEAYYTLREFDTLPSLLSGQGYACGLAGKWHLGDNLHPRDGFSMWVTKPVGSTIGFYDDDVIEHEKVRKEPSYQTDLWTNRGIEFIQKNREKPFFLFLAYNGPYGLGPLMQEPIRNRFADTYSNADLPSFPRTTPHPWNFNYAKFIGDPQVIRKYAAEISGIDDGIGRVMQTLKDLNLDDNTLVIFTADQGLAGGHSGFWGMGDHTRPLTAFDWGTHIPMIFRWPGHIASAKRNDLLVSNVDFLPTLIDYLKLPPSTRQQPKRPGQSIAPVLRGDGVKDWHDAIYYEFENVRSIRTDRWKFIERFREAPNELYDLEADPGELKNLVDVAEYARQRDDLRDRLHGWFDKVADPQWDLWKKGTSKSGLIMKDSFDNPGPYDPNAGS